MPIFDSLPSARTTPPALDDPTRYVRVPRVPILDVHARRITDKETGESKITSCDAEQLRVLAENSNRRAEEGNIGLVTVGHTDREKPETEQPPLVGYVKNFIVGQFNNRPTILADLYVEKDKESFLKEFPRRSVEVWNKMNPNGYIDVLALLKTSPERDLGLITHHSNSSTDIEYFECSCQHKENSGMNEETATDEKEDESKDGGFAADETTEKGRGGSTDDVDNDGDDENSVDDDTDTDTEDGDDDQAAAHKFADLIADKVAAKLKGDTEFHDVIGQSASKHHSENSELIDNIIKRVGDLLESSSAPEENENPENHSAEMGGSPSGTNTYVPGEGVEKMSKLEINSDPNVQIGLLAARLEKAEARIEDLTARNAELESFNKTLTDDNKKIRRRNRLESLVKHGVDIDVESKLEQFSKLDDDTFEMFAAEMETGYRRIPVDQPRLHSAPISGVPESPDASRFETEFTPNEVKDRAFEAFCKSSGIKVDSPQGGIDAVRSYFEKADRTKYGIRKKNA